MRVHLPSRWGNSIRGACGAGSKGEVSTSDNPSEITCRSCQQRIEDELKPIEEVINEEARRKARMRARSRASSEVVARHQDEFDELWVRYTAEAMEEALAEAKREIEQRQKWEQERVDRRRAELERELAALS